MAGDYGGNRNGTAPDDEPDMAIAKRARWTAPGRVDKDV